jgi:hypothetical protein
MIWSFGYMCLLMWFGAILMLVLPAAITIGSGIGASATSIIAYSTTAMMTPVRVVGGAISRLR